jgi:DNA-binding MarR family transcriptional regulator
MNRRAVRSHPGSPAFHFDDPDKTPHAPSPEQQEVLRADAAREQFRRHLRRRLFDPHLFGEPAWDILLALYVIDNVERRLSIAQLTTITHVPLTTALRWLAHLEEQDLVSRAVAPSDQRMVLIELTDAGRRSIDSYFIHAREGAVAARPPSAT